MQLVKSEEFGEFGELSESVMSPTAVKQHLTSTEKSVFSLLICYTNWKREQIAADLGISIRTVDFHVQSIYRKFRVDSRLELIGKCCTIQLKPKYQHLLKAGSTE